MTEQPLAILGAGPVGLLAALRGRQLGRTVDLYVDARRATEARRLECVPSQFVALLVEFGVHPSRIGVDRLFDRRWVQWSTRVVDTASGLSAAHVSRPTLEAVLLEEVERKGVTIRQLGHQAATDLARAHVAGEIHLIDASGRSALTAGRKIAPAHPLVARLFASAPRPSKDLSEFMIAAGPEGYAYRLGNAEMLTLGVVGRGRFVRGDGQEVIASIAGFAPWLVADLHAADLQAGASGSASVQRSMAGPLSGTLVGDAEFAHDALASQGLAMGVGGVLKALSGERTSRQHLPVTPRMAEHCQKVASHIASSPFSTSETWSAYMGFLDEIRTS